MILRTTVTSTRNMSEARITSATELFPNGTLLTLQVREQSQAITQAVQMRKILS